MSETLLYVIAALAVAVVAASCVAWLQARRLRRLGRSLEAFERAGHVGPLRLAEANGQGDETARLAAQIERMGDCLAARSAELAVAMRRRSELLANVSHDLRTPLAAMQGYLELLLLRQDNLGSAEARNYLHTATRQSERLGRLVADLFELTRLEGEGLQPEAEDFALAELAHDVAQKFALDAGQRGVRLEVRLDPVSAAVRVHAELGLIERLLTSLVENALRHTPGGGSVVIEAAPAEGRAEVWVVDTGEGIAAAELAGIFDHYDRAERVGGASRGSGHGGLGLAIARRIVELHGGRLRVESAPGRGTRIAFDLPLAPASAAAAACPASPRLAA
ncbi:MAG: HAMP domain-containing histidine kinase [Burkholderiales bacterium]|nr:HAMP domain-containing histidine kinase [Burkholderiales bacterium]